MNLATAFVLLTLQPTEPPCIQAPIQIFSDIPIVLYCRVQQSIYENTIRAGPNPKAGSLMNLSFMVHGAIKDLKAPPGWTVRRESGLLPGSIKVMWERTSGKVPSRPERTSLVFNVVVSGQDAWYYCPLDYFYTDKHGLPSGGGGGCPIG